MRRIGEAFFIALVLIVALIFTIGMIDQMDWKSLAKAYGRR